MDIAELLAFAVKNNASDLHLSSGLPPMIRVDGDIRRLTLPALDTAQLQELVYSTIVHTPQQQQLLFHLQFCGPSTTASSTPRKFTIGTQQQAAVQLPVPEYFRCSS